MLSVMGVRSNGLQIKHKEPSTQEFKAGAVTYLVTSAESAPSCIERPQGHLTNINHLDVSVRDSIMAPYENGPFCLMGYR